MGYLFFLGIPLIVYVALTAADKYTPMKRLLFTALTFVALVAVFVLLVIIGGVKPL